LILAESIITGENQEITRNRKRGFRNTYKIVSVLAGKEELGGDQGADERCHAVPRLAELEASRGAGWVTNDYSVGVCCRLEGSKTTGNDKSACTET
jgi:hypothetical protein